MRQTDRRRQTEKREKITEIERDGDRDRQRDTQSTRKADWSGHLKTSPMSFVTDTSPTAHQRRCHLILKDTPRHVR